MGFFSAVKRLFSIKTEDPESAESRNVPPSDTAGENRSESCAESDKGGLAAQNAEEQERQNTGSIKPDIDEGAECAKEGDAEPAQGTTTGQEIPPADKTEPSPDLAKAGDAGAPSSVMATDEVATSGSSDPLSESMILALRQAEPKLSSWLAIVLAGQEEVNEEFWQRLRFLLEAVEAPKEEIEAFISDFASWLERMEYSYVDEFRSELQYRLALALDLEDEEDERNRLLVKLSASLAATRMQLGRKLDALFTSHGELSEKFWEELEELFIMADMGYETSLEIVERLKSRAARTGVKDAAGVRDLLQDELADIFRVEPRIRATNKPEVILTMGVNGAGKTTTIGKLAYRDRLNGKKVLVAAADTFRAAAIEQLKVWADRAGAEFYARKAGSDPASVAWEAMDYALKNNIDVVYVDTAGRLQTRVNLMEELGKIRQVLAKKHPGSPHRSLLVLDATTGQNALSQARLFREAGGADELILTKLDGTAKGGVTIAVAMQEKLPISFIGLGEKMEDLRPFDGRDFAKALLEESAA